MTVLPHRPTLFIDRNSGGRTSKALIEAGLNVRVVLHDEVFKDPRTPDHEWLAEVGARGWLTISCDKATMKDPLFLRAVQRSQARMFLLDGLLYASKEAKAGCVIACYDSMLSICAKREPPLFWHFNGNNQPAVIDFRSKMGLLRKHAKMSGQP